jgi:hypothetical protein
MRIEQIGAIAQGDTEVIANTFVEAKVCGQTKCCSEVNLSG